MSALNYGINLPGPVLPFTDTDIYASHEAMWGKGGHRSVVDLTALYTIPALRREAGMTVYIIVTDTTYQLIAGFPDTIGSVTTAIDWKETNSPVAGTTVTILNAVSPITADSVNVKDFSTIMWHIIIRDVNKRYQTTIKCVNNGTILGGATDLDFAELGSQRIGFIDGLDVTVELDGIGIIQVMNLKIVATPNLDIKITKVFMEEQF